MNLNLPQVRGFFKGREGKVLTVYRRKFCIHVERVRFLISNLPNDMRHSSTGCYQLAFHVTSTSAQCVYAVYNLYHGPSTDVLHHFNEVASIVACSLMPLGLIYLRMCR